jgi:hypothetical protein
MSGLQQTPHKINIERVIQTGFVHKRIKFNCNIKRNVCILVYYYFEIYIVMVNLTNWFHRLTLLEFWTYKSWTALEDDYIPFFAIGHKNAQIVTN